MALDPVPVPVPAPAPVPAPRPTSARTLLALALAAAAGPALAGQDVMGTKHNLSVSGPGPAKALTETRACVFCHTPHNGAPLSPLWNRSLEPRVYTTYTSPTMQAGPLAQPWGPTKLCLTCHDGTIALGAVLNPAEGLDMVGGGQLPAGSLSRFGVDLSAHHPVSFPYQDSLPQDDLVSPPPAELIYGGTDEIHCITCHDAHEDAYGKFLVKDNRYSGLCTTCHRMAGWSGSAHATSPASVAGILPRPPKTWPTYATLGEWGCETCHTPHFAPTGEQLLNFTSAPPDPFSCTSAGCHGAPPPPAHGGAVATGGSGTAAAGRPLALKNIERQALKPSGHRSAVTSGVHGATGRGARGVACADCHSPHTMSDRKAVAPHVPGAMQGVRGVDRHGMAVATATHEHEVCFRCHADDTPDVKHVPRVLPETNTRRAFDPGNASFHPVVGMGRATSVPSIPSRAEPAMTPRSMIYCTDCHADDEGVSGGPHGSAFPPILRDRYEMADGTPESPESYALCYRCHERQSILADESFRPRTARTTATGGGHRGHLAAGAPCSACHDPHGVAGPAAGVPSAWGSGTHLINFDTRVVQPVPGGRIPVWNDRGASAGSCTLVCHGVTHAGASYP